MKHALRFAIGLLGLGFASTAEAKPIKVWLFGDGILYAMLLPPGGSVLSLPHTPGASTFPYVYMGLRSQFNFGGSSPTIRDYVDAATPNLPEHATPGARWPPDSTKVYPHTGCDDPRVGPASVRNRDRWDGLPCLTMSQEFLNYPSGFPTGIKSVAYVARPLSVIENVDPSGTKVGSTLDTLYIYHQPDYRGSLGPANPDGKPLMCAYEGAANGPCVWTSAPLWYFDRSELRQLAAVVLRSFGIFPVANPAAWSGPGSANGYGEPAQARAVSANARSAGKPPRGR